MNIHIRGTIEKKDDVIDYNILLIKLNNKDHKTQALCLVAFFLQQSNYPAVNNLNNSYFSVIKEFHRQLIVIAKSKQPNLPFVVMEYF